MMKKMYNVIAATVCAAMCVCACSSGREADGGKEPAKTQEVSKKKEKAYQKKLDMITPSAYDNVMGLDLEKGTTLSVIGKAKDVPYWDEVKKGAEQAVEDMNKNLGYEGKARIKLTYSAPAAADNVDEQVNILDKAPEYAGGLPCDDIRVWEYCLRYVKRQMCEREIPLSLFGNVGGIVSRENFRRGNFLATGAFVKAPEDFYYEDDFMRTGEIPEGESLCLYMERLFAENGDWRESEKMGELREELARRGLEAAGDYYGEVIADTPAFHYSGRNMLLRMRIAIDRNFV